MNGLRKAIKRGVADFRKSLQSSAVRFSTLAGRHVLDRDETNSLLLAKDSGFAPGMVTLLDDSSLNQILKWGVVKVKGRNCLDLDYGARSAMAGWSGPVVECTNAAALWSHPWMGYYHWIIDVAPKIALLQERFGKSLGKWKICYPRTGEAYESETLALLGVPESSIIDTKHLKMVSSRNVAFVMLPGWYRIQSAAELLRAKLTSHSGPSHGERIYVARAGRRRCVNEQDCFEMLRKRGFVFLEDRPRSVAEQMGIFKNAKVIVSPHGAALTNLLWCEGPAKIIEFFGAAYHPPYYENLSEFRSLEYYSLRVGNESRDHWSSMDEDIEVDIERLADILDQCGAT